MDKDSQINALLNRRFDKSPVQVWPATVNSVEGVTCTVAILNTDLVIDEVRLRADEDATDGVLLTPKVGSLVLVAVIENDLSNLYVCQVSEVDRVDAVIGKVTMAMSKDGVTAANDKQTLSLLASGASLKQDQTEVTLKNGYVTIKNSNLNLKEVFDSLLTLLNSFAVITPVMGVPTPSVAVSPASISSLAQLKVKVASILA